MLLAAMATMAATAATAATAAMAAPAYAAVPPVAPDTPEGPGGNTGLAVETALERAAIAARGADKPCIVQRDAFADARVRLERAGMPSDVASALLPPGCGIPGGSRDQTEDAAPSKVDADDVARAIELGSVRVRTFLERSARERSVDRDLAEATRRLEAILADPAFESDRDPTVVQRLLARVASAIEDVLVWLGRATGAFRGPLGTIVGIVLAGAAIAFVTVLVRAAMRRRTRRTPEPEAVPTDPQADDRRRAADLLADAEHDLAGGRWIAALKRTQAAVVRALVETGALPDRPSMTDLESLRLLADGPGHVDYALLVRTHDRFVYGGARPDRESCAHAVAAGRRVVAEVER